MVRQLNKQRSGLLYEMGGWVGRALNVGQESANPGWPATIFVSQVFLEYNHAHSFTYYLWPLLCYNTGVE